MSPISDPYSKRDHKDREDVQLVARRLGVTVEHFLEWLRYLVDPVRNLPVRLEVDATDEADTLALREALRVTLVNNWRIVLDAFDRQATKGAVRVEILDRDGTEGAGEYVQLEHLESALGRLLEIVDGPNSSSDPVPTVETLDELVPLELETVELPAPAPLNVNVELEAGDVADAEFVDRLVDGLRKLRTVLE